MNVLNILGILFAVGVLLASMILGNDNPIKLLDYHGILIVIGGTLACVGVAFRLDRALAMVLIFFRGMFTTKVEKNAVIIQQLMSFAEVYRKNPSELQAQLQTIKDPFLKEAMTSIVDELLDEDKLIEVLSIRANTMFQLYAEEAKMFVACGKFPPAMGLMGAVLGMIALLGGIGQPGGEKNVGPAMSVALVATLYGIALANLFIIPIGENLQEVARKIHRKNIIIVEGTRLIHQKINAIVLAEQLNSYLLPSERLDWKQSSQLK